MRRQVKFWQWLGRLAPIAGLLAVCLALYFDPDHWTDIIIIAIAISFGSIAFAWWWWVIYAVKHLAEMLAKSREDFGTILTEIVDLKKELMDSRFALATSQLEDTSVFKKIRKEIAQANTVLTEKLSVENVEEGE